MPELIKSILKYISVLADTTWLGKLFHMLTTRLQKQYIKSIKVRRGVVGRLGLGLGLVLVLRLGLGLALRLQLRTGIGFRRNHSWSSTFTPRRNHSLCQVTTTIYHIYHFSPYYHRHVCLLSATAPSHCWRHARRTVYHTHKRRSSVTFRGARNVCPKNMYEKLTKFSNFTRFLPDTARILHNNSTVCQLLWITVYSQVGSEEGQCPLPRIFLFYDLEMAGIFWWILRCWILSM